MDSDSEHNIDTTPDNTSDSTFSEADTPMEMPCSERSEQNYLNTENRLLTNEVGTNAYVCPASTSTGNIGKISLIPVEELSNKLPRNPLLTRPNISTNNTYFFPYATETNNGEPIPTNSAKNFMCTHSPIRQMTATPGPSNSMLKDPTAPLLNFDVMNVLIDGAGAATTRESTSSNIFSAPVSSTERVVESESECVHSPISNRQTNLRPPLIIATQPPTTSMLYDPNIIPVIQNPLLKPLLQGPFCPVCKIQYYHPTGDNDEEDSILKSPDACNHLTLWSRRVPFNQQSQIINHPPNPPMCLSQNVLFQNYHENTSAGESTVHDESCLILSPEKFKSPYAPPTTTWANVEKVSLNTKRATMEQIYQTFIHVCRGIEPSSSVLESYSGGVYERGVSLYSLNITKETFLLIVKLVCNGEIPLYFVVSGPFIQIQPKVNSINEIRSNHSRAVKLHRELASILKDYPEIPILFPGFDSEVDCIRKGKDCPERNMRVLTTEVVVLSSRTVKKVNTRKRFLTFSPELNSSTRSVENVQVNYRRLSRDIFENIIPLPCQESSNDDFNYFLNEIIKMMENLSSLDPPAEGTMSGETSVPTFLQVRRVRDFHVNIQNFSSQKENQIPGQSSARRNPIASPRIAFVDVEAVIEPATFPFNSFHTCQPPLTHERDMANVILTALESCKLKLETQFRQAEPSQTQGNSQSSPTQGNSHSSPTQGDSHSSPTQGNSQSSSTQGNSHSSPTQGNSHSSPTQGNSQSFPTDGHSQSFPTQLHSQSFPTQGNSQYFPTQGNSQYFPTEGHSQYFPTEGHSQSFPTQGNSQSFPTPPEFHVHHRIPFAFPDVVFSSPSQQYCFSHPSVRHIIITNEPRRGNGGQSGGERGNEGTNSPQVLNLSSRRQPERPHNE